MTPDNRLSLRLSPDVHAALSQVDDSRAYVEDLVRTRRREWQAAYLRLSQAGWTSPELCAATDALNGFGGLDAFGVGGGAACIPLELYDYQRLTDGCTKWSVEPARWQALVERLANEHEEAQALGLLAREFWLGNGEVEARIMGPASASVEKS